MTSRRLGHGAALLADGRVLIVGGTGHETADPFVTAELYDPATGTFSPTGSTLTPSFGLVATTLLDGRVLILGEDAELYEP